MPLMLDVLLGDAGCVDVRLRRVGATSHNGPAAARLPKHPSSYADSARSARRNNAAATNPPASTATAPNN
jgi:hypothetical protein